MSEEFYPVPVATLLAQTVPDFAIYLAKAEYQDRYVLYRREGLYLSPEHLRRLKRSVEVVYIRASERARQQRYMVETARRLISDPKRSSGEKAQVVYEFNKSAVQCALETPSERNIDTCRDLAREHVRYVATDPKALTSLLRIISYDYYTYTHSVNVCTFTVALCRWVGIQDLDELNVIGLGAMLHDIGKSRIDQKILNKPGGLSPAERELIEQHPQMGVEVLAETNPVPPEAVELVLNHHEKCDGSGYPRGLTCAETSLPVRACCLADIFDALTTHRCYKSAYAGFHALRLMQQEMHEQVDQQLLAELIRLVGSASQSAEPQEAVGA